MKKVGLVGVLLTLACLAAGAQESKYDRLMGFSLGGNYFWISGTLEPETGVCIVDDWIGFTYGFIPKEKGFASITTFSLPFLNVVDGDLLGLVGFKTHSYLGYGPVLNLSKRLRNGLDWDAFYHFSGGVHATIGTLVDGPVVLNTVSFGPAINVYQSVPSMMFKFNISIWCEPLSYLLTNVDGVSGWAKMNMGIGITYGF